jgi:hypothetical protein
MLMMDEYNERQDIRNLHQWPSTRSGVADFILRDACTGPDVFEVAGKWLRKHGTIPTCTNARCLDQ